MAFNRLTKITMGLFIVWMIACIYPYIPDYACPSRFFAQSISVMFNLLVVIASSTFAVLLSLQVKHSKKIIQALMRTFSISIVFCTIASLSYFLRNRALKFSWPPTIIQGQGLIAKIEDYKLRVGQYPTDLKEAKVENTSTGLCITRDFKYKNSSDSFSLSVDMPLGFLDWSELYYSSDQDYDKINDPIEDIGDWVFIYE